MRANRTLSPERRGTKLLVLAALRKKGNMEKPSWGLEFSEKTCHPPVPSAPPPFPERRIRHFVMEHLRHNSRFRNVLASPLGEEGHEVAKGVQANWIHRGAPRPANPVRRHPAKSVWTRVRMIMILLFYVLSPFAQGAADWRSGPRWSILSVLCPVHPFPLRGTSPQGETRK